MWLVQLGRIEAVVALLGGHALVGVPSGFQQFASKLYHAATKMTRCASKLTINLSTLINFLIHLSLRRGKRACLLRKKTSFSFAPEEGAPPARRRLRAGFDPTISPIVRTSLIPNAGLGLFAAQRIPQGKLVVQMAPTNVVQYKCSSSDKKVTKPCGLRICPQLIYTGDKRDQRESAMPRLAGRQHCLGLEGGQLLRDRAL